MLKRIFTIKNVLRSLVSAAIFLIFFFLVKIIFYYFGWEEKEGLRASGFVIYFVTVFLIFFLLDGREYTWKDVLTFKNRNKK